MKLRLIPGVAAAVIGIVGTGLAFAMPSKAWIGWIIVGLGAGVFLWGIQINGCHIWQLRPRWPRPRRGWYLGRILVSDDQLNAAHHLTITIFGYNGTRRKIRITGISGCIRLDFSRKGNGVGGFVLPAASVSSGSDWVSSGGELILSLRQSLEPTQVQQFRAFQQSGATPHMMFKDFKLEAVDRRGGPIPLPLWDGISLAGGLVSGVVHSRSAIISMRAEASASDV